MTARGITPSQTVGPYFEFALTPANYSFEALVGNDLITEDTVGEHIHIEGRILGGDGAPVPDAFVEVWQADGTGRYPGHGHTPPNSTFKGFGRANCDESGAYRLRTVKPGQVPGPNEQLQAPHINVGIFARGILRRMFTRIYFDGEAANDSDAILALVPEGGRHTLIARHGGSVDGEARYVFDIRLQGENETVFFEA
jgi:protocatechuate 3,4-dioxygenase alpha subunit